MALTLMRSLPAKQGRALSNRYRARRFTHDHEAHEFLAKGDNALHWSELSRMAEDKTGRVTGDVGSWTLASSLGVPVESWDVLVKRYTPSAGGRIDVLMEFEGIETGHEAGTLVSQLSRRYDFLKVGFDG